MKQFFLRPSPRLAVEVRIYDTHAAMLKAAKRKGGDAGPFVMRGKRYDSPGALTMSYRCLAQKGRRWVSTPLFATVFLHRRQMGAETVCHELAHVIRAWVHRVRLPSCTSADERFCYAYSEMVRQFGERVWWAKRRRA